MATESFRVYRYGDPGRCRSAADDLRATGRGIDSATTFLDDQVALPEEDFDGHTGNAYRDACGILRSDLDAAGSDVGALATDLDTYADRLTDVNDVMTTALRMAPSLGLEVSGDEVGLPAGASDQQSSDYRRLRTNVGTALEARAWADQQWERSLERHAGGLAAPYLEYPVFPLPEPDPGRWPIPDSHWPDPATRPPPDTPGLGGDPGRGPGYDPDTDPDRRLGADPTDRNGPVDRDGPPPDDGRDGRPDGPPDGSGGPGGDSDPTGDPRRRTPPGTSAPPPGGSLGAPPKTPSGCDGPILPIPAESGVFDWSVLR